MKPKEKIFQVLNKSDDVVSGETMSAELGVSRVSIWKHIKGMVASGIPIVSTPKGYRLNRDPDRLMPLEFGSRRDRIHYFQETTSTMDEAAALARKGCPEFTVVVAQRQTRGRGRMMRTWLSADGGLYFNVVLRPEIPIVLAGLVNMAAAIDMAHLLESSYKIEARLKWPNDLLVNGKKICGVLSQAEIEGAQIAYMNIGIGLNVNNSPEIEEPVAISMKALLGEPMPRRELLEAFLNLFEKRMTDFNSFAVIDQWRLRNVTLGQSVRIVTIKDEVEGTAIDIDDHGGLIVELDDGTRRIVTYGDCFHN